ncbi:transporter [Donghicola sp. C2-DW-16]|uniref:Transporter n=1 Tax=Donghicola mangrovi TaxID=2729614 RepID=A0ABX2PFP1_9RHOB|nr:outer membrane protein transport protein [Donghicola mangrovi]NVO27832.1 transporter [Donghicola mangrovi]
MKTLLLGSAAIAVLGTSVAAGGIERSNQSTSVLYKKGNYVEFGFGEIRPSVSGKGETTGYKYDNVANDFSQKEFRAKIDLNDKLSFGMIMDSPFGADIEYGGNSTTTELGGTKAFADVKSQSFLLKYQINENASVFGGLRRETASGEITLDGTTYGGTLQVLPPALGSTVVSAGASGYNIELSENVATGYTVGAAYEIPDIALRVALTFNTEINHKMDVSESLPVDVVVPGVGVVASSTITQDGTLDVKIPKSWNLDFQSGVAPGTLVFGSVRWVEHSAFGVYADLLGSELVSLEDTYTYTLGVGHRYSPNLAVMASISHERAGDDEVSPLAPTNGYTGISLGGAYTFDNGFELSGGATWRKVGDAKGYARDAVRANFDGNTVVGAGIKLSYNF